jgi:hypothetical protein
MHRIREKIRMKIFRSLGSAVSRYIWIYCAEHMYLYMPTFKMEFLHLCGCTVLHQPAHRSGGKTFDTAKNLSVVQYST